MDALTHPKFRFVAALASGLVISLSANAQTIAQWTFETSVPLTAGPITPETGTGSASGSHASGVTVYSSPSGNGSTHSYSANTWAINDYWQFSSATAGYSGIQLDWDETSSGTGPRDFVLSYSTDGSTFTPFGSPYTVLANAAPNPLWNTSTASSLTISLWTSAQSPR